MSAQIGINELKELSAAMSARSGYAFESFSHSFLKRRLTSFFKKFHIKSFDQFIKQLSSKLFLESILYHFAVNTTEMFRDPGFWRSLKSKVLTDAVVKKNAVWFPDIASGEELFSFLVLSRIACEESIPEIYFHHPSSSRIDEVKTGMVRSGNSEHHINNFKRLELGGQIDTYFNQHSNCLVLNDDLLKNIHSQKGWFLTEPQCDNFGLIFMRNSMLFMDRILQEKVCNFIFDKLVPGGYFVIGIKECLPDSFVGKVQVIDEQERIYRKPIIRNGL